MLDAQPIKVLQYMSKFDTDTPWYRDNFIYQVLNEHTIPNDISLPKSNLAKQQGKENL